MRLVVPHFGPRPAYFPLVVRSMAANPDVSWLLLTEQPVPDPTWAKLVRSLVDGGECFAGVVG
jgi:hypothetical protein